MDQRFRTSRQSYAPNATQSLAVYNACKPTDATDATDPALLCMMHANQQRHYLHGKSAAEALE